MTQYLSHRLEGLKTSQKVLNLPSVIPLTAGNELIGKELIGQEIITQELLLHPSSFFANRELVPLGDRPDSYLVLANYESGWHYYLLINGLIYLIGFYTQKGQRVAVFGSELAALVEEMLVLWDEQSNFIVLNQNRSLFKGNKIVIEIILITRHELPSSEAKVMDQGGKKMLEMPSNLELTQASGALESQKSRIDVEIIRQMFADERGLPCPQLELPCSQEYYSIQVAHREVHKPRSFEIDIEISSYKYPALPSSQPALGCSTELVVAGSLDVAVRRTTETAIQPCYGFEIDIELRSQKALPMGNELPSPPVDCTSIVPFCQDIQHRYGWEVEIQLGKNLSTRALHGTNALPMTRAYPSIKAAQEQCTALIPYKGSSLIPSKENSLVLYNRSASKPITPAQSLDLNLASYLRKMTLSSRLQLIKPIHLEDLDYVSTLVPKFSDPDYSPNFDNMEVTTQKLISTAQKNFTQLAYPLKFQTSIKKMKIQKLPKLCLKPSKHLTLKTEPLKTVPNTLEIVKFTPPQHYLAPTLPTLDDMRKQTAKCILERQATSVSTYRLKDHTIPSHNQQTNALVPYYKDNFDKRIDQLCRVCRNKPRVDSVLKQYFHNRLALNYITAHTYVNPVQNTSLNTNNLSNDVHEIEIHSGCEVDIHHKGSVDSELFESEYKVDDISFEESELELDDRFDDQEQEEGELLPQNDSEILEEDDYEICLEEANDQNDKDYDILQEVGIADNNFEILN